MINGKQFYHLREKKQKQKKQSQECNLEQVWPSAATMSQRTRAHTHTPQKHCKHTFHKTLGRYKVNHSTIKTAYSTPHYRRSQSDDGVYTGDVPKNTCCGAATYLQSPPMRGSSSRKHWCHDFFFFFFLKSQKEAVQSKISGYGELFTRQAASSFFSKGEILSQHCYSKFNRKTAVSQGVVMVSKCAETDNAWQNTEATCLKKVTILILKLIVKIKKQWHLRKYIFNSYC